MHFTLVCWGFFCPEEWHLKPHRKSTHLPALGPQLMKKLSWERCVPSPPPPPPCCRSHCLPAARHKGVNEGAGEEVRRGDVRIFAGKECAGGRWPGRPGLAAPPRHSSCPVPTGGEWHGGSEWTSTKRDPLLPGPSCWAVTATNSWLHL